MSETDQAQTGAGPRLIRWLQGLFGSATATRAWEPRPDHLFLATRAAFRRPEGDGASHSHG